MPVNAQSCTGNPIKVENCLTGTKDWQIPLAAGLHPTYKPSTQYGHEVEGYANKTSVNAGEQIRFHFNVHFPAENNAPNSATVDVDIYRLGYYNGNGGRLVYSFEQIVPSQAIPSPNLTIPGTSEDINGSGSETGMGLAECNWSSGSNSYWNVPSTATSGVYLAKLTRIGTGHQSYIPFVVRNDSQNSAILVQQSVTTYQAYNDYPGLYIYVQNYPVNGVLNGKSLYESASAGPELYPESSDPNNSYPSGGPQARKVSFNRPYIGYTYFGIYESAGLGFFASEYPMLRWLEKNGYDVTYATDIDTHMRPEMLASNKHQAFLSVGHDEYWSWQMRDNVERARDRANNGTSKPINIGFFGANTCFWQIRLSKSTSNSNPANEPNRTMVAYKDKARGGLEAGPYGDPYYINSSSARPAYMTSYLWRHSRLTKPTSEPFYLNGNASPYFQPEDEMIGIMSIRQFGDIYDTGDPNPEHYPTTNNGGNPTFAGSNEFVLFLGRPAWVTAGIIPQDEAMANMMGYEADDVFEHHDYSADGRGALQYIGKSPFLSLRGKTLRNLGDAKTTFYRKGNLAKVFAAGGIQWSYGLDNWGADSTVGPLISGRSADATYTAQYVTTSLMNCLINQTTACNQ